MTKNAGERGENVAAPIGALTLHNYRNALAGYLLLLCTVGAIQFYFSYRSIYSSGYEIEQRVNWNIATHLAADIQPLLLNGIDNAALQRQFQSFLRYHPAVDLYLVANDGSIITHAPLVGDSGEQHSAAPRIDTAPIEEFLRSAPDAALPIWGDIPSDLSRKGAFSAARVSVGTAPAYLYAVFYGFNFQRLTAGKLENWSLFIKLLCFGLGFLLISALICGIRLGRLMRRFFSVLSSLKRISAGDYSHRIPTAPKQGELSDLAAAANTMADNLVAGIERARRNEQITKDLVANIIHDLNSPIAAVYGSLSRVVDKADSLDAATRKDYLQIALNNVSRLSRLVSEMLELSKLDSGMTQPQLIRFSLGELITEEIVPSFATALAEKGLTLELQGEIESSNVQADDSMIERVLTNLLENAVRHHDKPAGKILISLRRIKDKIQVQVSDDGPGIPAEELPFIFDRFYRGDSSRQKATGGSGLGLAIVKVILESHGESLYAESTVGAGSCFTFQLTATRSSPGETSVSS